MKMRKPRTTCYIDVTFPTSFMFDHKKYQNRYPISFKKTLKYHQWSEFGYTFIRLIEKKTKGFVAFYLSVFIRITKSTDQNIFMLFFNIYICKEMLTIQSYMLERLERSQKFITDIIRDTRKKSCVFFLSNRY